MHSEFLLNSGQDMFVFADLWMPTSKEEALATHHQLYSCTTYSWEKYCSSRKWSSTACVIIQKTSRGRRIEWAEPAVVTWAGTDLSVKQLDNLQSSDFNKIHTNNSKVFLSPRTQYAHVSLREQFTKLNHQAFNIITHGLTSPCSK